MTTALILAGKRDGLVDPLAERAGVSHKCLVPVAGRPLIAHVLAALAAAPHVRRILISIDDPAPLAAVAEVRDGLAQGRVAIVPARANIVDSVADAAAGAPFPLLVTTADNVLIDPAALAEIDMAARTMAADVAVAFTRRASVLAAHPDGQRRFYRFSDDAYSNCNAYWLGSPRALAAAEVFRQGGQFAKHPLRIVRAFGILNLIRFRYGIGSLDAAFQRFSRRFGAAIRPVILTNGAVAIDVDNPRTHAIAESLLTARNPQTA
ncbi:MAG: spore coat biosynthesis protein F [Sphingomonas sp. SCN 67-18]|uniref:NTP transferase domain-containing protein n=1 Tax=uncultured Sphingomonas sp. TaxID=158754 RepID=UPI00086A9336|nr:NTP transferase domain-containing protein [Sphingomonas sp. SCN 67-18]ODU22675.1 MAG: spore coat biosynthesis protein F [Sphingomonas sp. SCN 67-18]